jgi:hypothetical protein
MFAGVDEPRGGKGLFLPRLWPEIVGRLGVPIVGGKKTIVAPAESRARCTLMIQRVLTEPDWTQRMLPEDLRARTPLIYSHVTPYGTFRLDMNQRLAIEQDAIAA